MADEAPKKKIDESWKEQAELEKRAAQAKQASPASPTSPTAPVSPGSPAQAPPPADEEEVVGPDGAPQARFDLFLSGLAMEALIALGDAPHPVTRRQGTNLAQAKYMIDLLGILEQKTAGNLDVDEEKMLKDALYQLRMRYLAKGGGAA